MKDKDNKGQSVSNISTFVVLLFSMLLPLELAAAYDGTYLLHPLLPPCIFMLIFGVTVRIRLFFLLYFGELLVSGSLSEFTNKCS